MTEHQSDLLKQERDLLEFRIEAINKHLNHSTSAGIARMKQNEFQHFIANFYRRAQSRKISENPKLRSLLGFKEFMDRKMK